MARAIVLGGGMVGQVMAADLASNGTAGAGGERMEVTVADASLRALEAAAERCRRMSGAEIRTETADCSDPAVVTRLAKEHDLVLGALPSRLGLAALDAVLVTGRPYCDISFMAESPLDRDELARSNRAIAVVDCGVAPGLSHMMAARGAAALDRCDEIEILVGGLPVERRWPHEYKAAFSPEDVLEEYTRESRLVEHGRVVTRPALSEPERVDLPGVGTLEAFNTDGLRSLVETMDVRTMREKTLRYPGHRALMEAFRATGLFSTEPVDVDGRPVVPRALMRALLFPQWTYEEDEADLTVMRVDAIGELDGRRTRIRWDLLDFLDPETGATSMARTTAFPATIVARLLIEGAIATPGVLPPERLGADEQVFDHVITELVARGVSIEASVEGVEEA